MIVIPRPHVPDPVLTKPVDRYQQLDAEMLAAAKRYLERYLREHGYYPWERHLHEDPPSRRSEYKPTVDPKREAIERMLYFAAKRQIVEEAENRRLHAQRWQAEWTKDVKGLCQELRGSGFTKAFKKDDKALKRHLQLVNDLERSLLDPTRPVSEARKILEQLVENYPKNKQGYSSFNVAKRNTIYERLAAKLINSLGRNFLRPGVAFLDASKNKQFPDYATLSPQIVGDALGLQLNPGEDIASRVCTGITSKVATYPNHDVIVVIDVHGVSAAAVERALPAIRRKVAAMQAKPRKVYVIVGGVIFEI